MQVLANPVVMPHIRGTGRAARVAVRCVFPCAQVILEMGLEERCGNEAVKGLNCEDANEVTTCV